MSSCAKKKLPLEYLPLIHLITSLAKEVMFLVALVSLSVDNITQNFMNGLG